MISVNDLRVKVLSTVDEVIFHAPTEDNVDARSIKQSIIIAERSFVVPMLGYAIYDRLVTAKNKIVTQATLSDLQTAVNTGRIGRQPITLVVGDYVNSDTYLTTTDLELWQEHLHKIVAECVYHVALPVNRSRFSNQGVNVNNPASIASASTVASIELRDLKHLIDNSLLRRIAPLMESLHMYMCTKKFTGYTKDCGCNSDGVPYQKRNSISFGMYEDDDNTNCNSCY